MSQVVAEVSHASVSPSYTIAGAVVRDTPSFNDMISTGKWGLSTTPSIDCGVNPPCDLNYAELEVPSCVRGQSTTPDTGCGASQHDDPESDLG